MAVVCAAAPGPPCSNARRSTDVGNMERPSSFVSVAVRVRPTNRAEDVVIWAKKPDGSGDCRRVCCHRGFVLDEYEFSHVFGPEDNNACLFEKLHGPSVVDSIFSGVNETLFAYGQTGSGKTHTIFGTAADPGFLQFFVNAVFERTSTCPGSTVHVCCYEVLGDVMTDLINPAALVRQGHLKAQDIVWDELFLKTQKFRYQIVQVACEATCLRLLQGARENRAVGVSSCNANSSRSHAVVHLFIQNPQPRQLDCQEEDAGNNAIAALTLVDLAGAEKEHENPSEQGRKSTRLLNTSLSSLNRLLRKLQTNSLDESERRQSVLNKCLWEYLRPGSGIALIFCVSPLLKHRTTSLSTLSMASSSKSIRSSRKQQYVFLPNTQHAANVALDVASPHRIMNYPRVSSHADMGTPRTPSSPCAATPRGRSVRSDAFLRSGRTPDRTSTPRASTPSNGAGLTALEKNSAACSSPFCMPPFGEMQNSGEQRRRNSFHSVEAASVHFLEVKNAELQRKLAKVRTRSREKLVDVEQDRAQLSTENKVLRQECEALRSLLLRQQQEQIAFWAGPFMEMMIPKGSNAADAPDGLPITSTQSTYDPMTHGSTVDEKRFNDCPEVPHSCNILENVQRANHEAHNLIKNVPTPLSAQRKLQKSPDFVSGDRGDVIIKNIPRRSRLSLERGVVKVDLCDTLARSGSSRGSRCCSTDSDSDSLNAGHNSDDCTESARST